MKKLVLPLLLAVAGLSVWAQRGAKPAAPDHGNADALTAAELQHLLYFIASDALAGRATPSAGQDAAAAFIAENVSEWGLVPVAANPAASGPLEAYYLPIEMESARFDAASSAVTLNGASFRYGRDYLPTGAAQAADGAVSAAMVFAGNGYVFLKDNVNPYQGLDVRGRIVVVAGGVPAAYAAAVNPRGRGRGAPANAEAVGVEGVDWFTPQGWAEKNGGLAVVTCATLAQYGALADPEATLAAPAGGRGGPANANRNGPAFTITRFDQAAAAATVPSLTAGPALLNAIFAGERTSAAAIVANAALPAGHVDSFALGASKVLSVKLAATVQHARTQDILAVIPGSDPVLKNEYVMLSAHVDHLGVGAPLANGHTVFNGADDDGSGTTALLAMAHALARGAKPRRSILFVWHTGEEKGLWGSEYLARFPPLALDEVVADLNMDMIGRSRPEGDTNPADAHLSRPGAVNVVGPHISSDDLEQAMDTVNAGYLKLNFDHYYDTTDNPDMAFYRSDQYNYARLGIPVIFFTTGLHSDYHTQRDTPEKVDYQQQEKIARTIAALAWTLANQTARPKLNANLPPALVTAMQQARAQGWGQPGH